MSMQRGDEEGHGHVAHDIIIELDVTLHNYTSEVTPDTGCDAGGPINISLNDHTIKISYLTYGCTIQLVLQASVCY